MKTKHTMKFGSRIFYPLARASTLMMVIASISILADTAIAAHYYGEIGLNAINMVTPITGVIYFVSVINGYGTANVYSREIGRFRKDEAGKIFGQGLMVSIVVGFFLCILTLLGKNLYFLALGKSLNTSLYAQDYYMAYPLIMLIQPMEEYLSAMIYADGDEKTSNICSLVHIVGTVVLSIVFCKELGLFGIGLGSFLTLVIKLPIELSHFLKPNNSIEFKIHFSFSSLKRVIRYGIVDGQQYLCLGIMVYIFNAFVVYRFGDIYLTIVTLIVSLIEICAVFDGVGEAITPIINVYLEEENNDGIVDTMKTARLFSVVEAIVVTVLLVIFAPIIPKVYGIDISQIEKECMYAMRIFAGGIILISLEYLYSSYYIIKQQIGIAIGMATIYSLLAPVLLGIPLSLISGLNGLWLGVALSPFCAIYLPRALMRRKYTKPEIPYLLNLENDLHCKNFDITLTQDTIVELRNQVSAYLKDSNLRDADCLIMQVEMVLEEYCILVNKVNHGRKVYVQCSLYVKDQIRIILRDTGEIFDFTNPSDTIDEISSPLVKRMMNAMSNKKYLTTIGFNRNELYFDL